MGSVRGSTRRALRRLSPATYEWARLVVSPRARAHRRFVSLNGTTVRAGPFEGLRYPLHVTRRVGPATARLCGTFERELHDAVGYLISQRPATIVDVGSAEGYYAVGLAKCCPDSDVIAFEAEAPIAEDCRAVAQANGVSNVELRGLCSVEALSALNPGVSVALICDVEGAEFSILDPELVPWLDRVEPLIVEVHTEGGGDPRELEARLAKTHVLQRIRPSLRSTADAPPDTDFSGLESMEPNLLFERPLTRPGWLVGRPRRS